jgi:subtilisin family serine protease
MRGRSMNGRWRRAAQRALVGCALLALSGSVTVTVASPGGGQPGDPALVPVAQAEGRSAGGATWVTLLTGDRVLMAEVGGDLDVMTVDPGPGRDGVGFHRYEGADGEHVVPLDAAPLLGRDQLDERLFAVSALVEAGYDDRSRPDLPLIVAAAGDAPVDAAAARTRLTTAGATPTDELPSIGAVAVQAPKARAGELWEQVTRGTAPASRAGEEGAGAEPGTGTGTDPELAPELTRIWLDGPVRPTLDESVPQIGAPAAHAAGHTGAGAVVAVLDTGIDEAHPDLADAIVGAQDFTGLGTGPAGAHDGHGHGTHVASIVTGSGAASGGRYAGVAPDAGLLVGKVLTDQGFGLESWLIEGMEWAAAQGAPVVNMSLGSDIGDGTGVVDQAVDSLTATSGTLFVVAAGNTGPRAQTVTSPGTADAALTVGAVDDADQVTDTSARGPRWNRPAIKPDLTAPGVGIVAARARGTQRGEPVDDSYTRLSGTSMATPHVAGAAAILAAQHPDWRAEQLRGVLTGSAAPQDGQTVYDQGAGRLDVARADTQPVWATPGSIDHGTAAWPHDDDQPTATPVTVRNGGTTPVTLDLTADVSGPTGAAAPAGMVTLSADQVTVPAGGEATVVVTTSTAVPGPDGLYQGRITARDGTGRVAVHVPLAVAREVESYDVTLQVLDRAGTPTRWYDLGLTDVDAPERRTHRPYGPSGTATVRLPRGTYYLDAALADADTGWSPSVYMVEPSLEVNADATITLDGRQARPVGATVDRPDAAVARTNLLAERQTASGPMLTSFYGDALYARPSDTAAPAGELTFEVEVLLARPDGAGGFAGSPYLDHVQWSRERRIPRRLVPHVPDDELAVVRSRHAAASSAVTTALRDGVVTFPLPGRLVERYTPGVLWPRHLDTSSETGWTSQWAVVRSFELGQRHRERWNGAVFGPPDPGVPAVFGAQLIRSADMICAWVPLFSDQAGHFSFSMTDSSSLTLSRDGQQYGGVPDPCGTLFMGVPAEEATYRLEADATRRVFDLSTRVTAAWTFRSATTADLEPLPLLGVRFLPRLDDHNRAPSGQDFSFPVRLGRQPGPAYGTVDELTVDVSYDDGQTWQPVALSGTGDERTATVTHPAGPGFVSLRARARDTAGNALDQTIIRAYGLR